eukprot:gene1821-33239_t
MIASTSSSSVRSRSTGSVAQPTRTVHALANRVPELVPRLALTRDLRNAPVCRADAPKTGSKMTEPPSSMAQTVMRGPLKANGSGKPLTKAEMDACKQELEDLKKAYNFVEPARSFMDDPEIKWRFGGPPDYSLTNLQFLQGRTTAHPEGSLELIVENLVKTWEMDVPANGWKKYNNEEANTVGNYNVLMDGVPSALWDKENISWEQSHERFHDAFAAFPWEVLEVFSGPPSVAFSWRHWANFTGTYEGNQGSGELVEMFGFGIGKVNDKLQLVDIDIYYKPNEFLEVLRGERPASDLSGAKTVMGQGCPFLARV